MKVSFPQLKVNLISIFVFFVCIYTTYNIANATVISGLINNIRGFWTDKATTSLIVENDTDHVLRVSDRSVIEKESPKGDSIISTSINSNTIKVQVGLLRTEAEEEIIDNDTINVYEVKKGDSLSDVATIYGVTRNTIIWANDIKGGKIKEGDTLIILPISGVKHTIKKGDTVKSIAKKYKADANDILEFNSITEDSLALGEEIIIPDGQINIDAPVKKSAVIKKKIYSTSIIGYFTRPVLNGIKTQGIHGKNAVDIGAKVGTGIIASARGVVQVARTSGYNGGYGKMVIISHPNGTQTLYAHMNKVNVVNGEKVLQGQLIGEVGSTGKSTGPHLHFEVRGAENPF
jgi:murein DD-endopeptidase MepM/ murein hydrolase activator NlpD